jgi:electron transfer flavoprotein beta subunit
MKIVVCIKYIPKEIRIDAKTKTLDRSGEQVINPCDLNAVEAALDLRDRYGAETYAITMGVPEAAAALRQCLAMGIGQAILLSDPAFAGADGIATTATVAAAIRQKIPDFDLILCGKSSADAETGIFGPALAEQLDVPVITFVDELALKDQSTLIAGQEQGGSTYTIEAALPAVVTVSEKLNVPRGMHINEIKRAATAIPTLTVHALGLAPHLVGAAGSLSTVGEMVFPQQAGETRFIPGDAVAAARQIAGLVREKLAAEQR